METRTTSAQVTFLKPFRLEGVEKPQPPGTYTVDIEEEQLDAFSVIGWRQVSATLRIVNDGAVEFVPVAPQDLQAALMRDGDPTATMADRS